MTPRFVKYLLSLVVMLLCVAAFHGVSRAQDRTGGEPTERVEPANEGASVVQEIRDYLADIRADATRTKALTRSRAIVAKQESILASLDEIERLLASRGDATRPPPVVEPPPTRPPPVVEPPPTRPPPDGGETEPPPGTRPPPDETRPPPTDPGTRPPPTDPGTRPPPTDPGTRPPPVDPPGTGQLATLRATMPAPSRLIRGTLPVPTTFSGPVHLRDSRGTALPTQIETVSRYPDGKPRVIEVLALSDATVAGPQDFALVSGAGPTPVATDGPDCGFAEAVDHRGTVYGGSSSFSAVTYRSGPVATTRHEYGWLTNGGIKLLGFASWETEIAGEDVTLVEFIAHNGPTAPVQGDAYFKQLRVSLPQGYVATHLWPEPWAGSDGFLIKPDPAGTMHGLQQKQQREWRFAIHKPGNDARARALLEMHGFAVCLPVAGQWSWFNPSTPGYGPHAISVGSLHGQQIGWGNYPYGLDRSTIWNALSAGTPLPDSQGGNQGSKGSPFHPYFWSDGNGASGTLIWQIDGMAILTTGDWRKLTEAMAVHRCLTDRHRVGIYAADGSIHKAETTTGNWKVTAYPGQMWGGMAGQLDYNSADQWRRNEVTTANRMNAYDAYLRGYSVFDFAHLTRRLSGSLVLAWLANDPIARHSVATNAEWARMWAYEKGNGDLIAANAKAIQFPGKGGFGGRDPGWATTAIAAAYQLSDDPRREERFGPWFETFTSTMQLAQMPSGGWLAHESGKPTDGFTNQAVSQSFEVGIHAGGLRSVWAATGDGRIPPMLLKVAQAHGITPGGTATFHWLPGWGGPQTKIAVRPKDPAQPAYWIPQASPIPLATDNWQTATLLHWGLMVAPNDPLIRAAVNDMLGANPLATMLAKPLDRLDNRAGLLGFYQTTP